MRLLRELRDRKQITIIMALHDINMALQFERVVVVKDGNIVGMGNPETVLSEGLLKEAFDVSVDMKRHGPHL
jgi:iron complex transport system ATP-binding protein